MLRIPGVNFLRILGANFPRILGTNFVRILGTTFALRNLNKNDFNGISEITLAKIRSASFHEELFEFPLANLF